MKLEIEYKGLKQAVAKIEDLSKKMQGKVIRKGLRAGAKVWQSAARGEAPVRTGILKRSIKVRAGKRTKTSIAVTVGMGAKDYQGKGFYGAFIEYGYHIGKRSLGSARKQQPANPFLLRAFKSSSTSASETAIDKMKEEIEALT